MHFKTLIAYIFLFVFVVACNSEGVTVKAPQIIPQPNTIIQTDGFFALNKTTTISYDTAFTVSANFLKSFVKLGSGITLKEGNSIVFIKDDSLAKEAYTLLVSEDRIEIKASTDQGAFYAVQSLRQLLPTSLETGNSQTETINIPCVTITDAPQFSYRGMHLDVGRHMYSVAFIKKYIDALAMLKINTFHWHLTEDQGWRIEIKKYPKLQEIAAYRNETLKGHYNEQPQQFDGKRYGGYYTQKEIKIVVKYAQERFITIIPEIEMPGHSQAAIAAYPELGCTSTSSIAQEPIAVATKWGVFEHIYCTKEETFTFLEDVLDEVMVLFPSQYIHIGGDEAPKTKWKTCKQCQKRIKDEGLKDEHELQNYFITRMEKYLNSKGRQIIGWDEILEGGLAPNATVMSWRGTKGAIEAAKSGHNVVMTPTSHCYFDYYQSDNEDEPLAIGGFLPLEKVYGFNPIPEELSKEESKYVLGAQGNIWTEYMPTEDNVEYMAFPRLLAMSEVLWSQVEQKDYKGFVSRLENFHNRLDALDINYANHLYEIEGNMISEKGKAVYELKTLTEGKTIHYTLNGNKPTLYSEIYKNPIPVTKNQMIKAAVFNTKQQLGKLFTQEINYHKAVGAKITINKMPHKAYSGSGAEGLINGISGSDTRYGDKEWLGFWGEDIEITIDLGKIITVNSIKMRCYNANGQWIYAPTIIEIEVEDEANDSPFDDTLEPALVLNEMTQNPSLKNYQIDFRKSNKVFDSKTRYIKIKVPNYGTIPEGKQGAGNKAWTFIDEIIVK